jgi:hypothetical protein
MLPVESVEPSFTTKISAWGRDARIPDMTPRRVPSSLKTGMITKVFMIDYSVISLQKWNNGIVE